MFGVVDQLYLCNQQRSRELNDRISVRNIPSAPLQPQFSMRPVLTKYSMMPILDQRATPSVPLEQFPTFNPEQTFNPGNAQAPWSLFSSNVNTESILRNQVFALQNCEQAYYVPSSKSELFNVRVPEKYVEQPHPDLFNRQQFCQHNPNEHNLANKFFNNSTRHDIKNL
jgi:hypothetical protein